MASIIVHGGAGAIDEAQSAPHRLGCQRAAEAGARVLAAGGLALDAVIAAVRVLEDNPVFNAGTGGALDEDGLVLLDAAVMRGADLAYGAVGAVAGVQHPIDLARAVLDDGRHSILVGPGAIRFARKKGIALVDPRRLATDPSRAKWWFATAERRAESERPTGDTVGAVARDARGGVAAATSTGGILGKYAGRVGDSPVAGAGVYARDDLGAISATGHGETILKTVLGFQALAALSRAPERPAAQVLTEALDDATARAGGRGGLIVALPDGRVAFARNTPHMGVAWIEAGGDVQTAF
ncbi:MAG: isoaspartyl peptidase/L-asparaginase [Deltaproteobacteria bacterium]|nr:isoaspartyl peptidase/L-asparaginase [Deltaproteobacteria bacterium]